MAESLGPLPPGFGATRDSLRALACFAISPARKARTGRIGLRPTGDGFGTPPFDDGTTIAVRGDRLYHGPGDHAPITTVRVAAALLGVELRSDPGVGDDLPPFDPDADLGIDAEASLALGAWYAFGQEVLDAVTHGLPAGPVTEAQLWPEHFDLAVTATLAHGMMVNVGASPGDWFCAEPYVYVGPHETATLDDAYWNAPFGAFVERGRLATADPKGAAAAFVRRGLDLLAR